MEVDSTAGDVDRIELERRGQLLELLVLLPDHHGEHDTGSAGASGTTRTVQIGRGSVRS
jgi:hypothetical protein